MDKHNEATSHRPVLSIVTICRNSEQHIAATIESVLGQASGNWEYVLIDGASTDSTVAIIRSYEQKFSDKGVRLRCSSEADDGIYDAMNKGVALAEGEWLLCLNSGDLIYDDMVLAKILKTIEQNRGRFSFLYSDTQLFDNLRSIDLTIAKADHIRNVFIHQSCVYKKDLHEKFGNYLVAPRLTISDYLFFNLVPKSHFLKVEFLISRYDINGVSNNFDTTFFQKLSVDLLMGNLSPAKVFLELILSPLKKLKQKAFRLIRRVRKR